MGQYAVANCSNITNYSNTCKQNAKALTIHELTIDNDLKTLNLFSASLKEAKAKCAEDLNRLTNELREYKRLIEQPCEIVKSRHSRAIRNRLRQDLRISNVEGKLQRPNET